MDKKLKIPKTENSPNKRSSENRKFEKQIPPMNGNSEKNTPKQIL